MLRYLLVLLVALALVAGITRAPGVWRVLWVALGVILLYAVLKLTGAIDALAPSRTGVF